MLDPFDLWLIKSWPNDVENYVKIYWPWALSLYKDNEICRSNREDFDFYKDQDILIVGGGPTTDALDWSKSALEHDYIWSCNHFFQNKKLQNVRVDLAMIMPGVDLNNTIFNNIIRLDNTLIGIELHDKWMNNQDLNNFIKKYSSDKIFFSHSRFFGKLGIGARMIILAASLGAAKVSFIGFDGPVIGHSFEPGKYKLPAGVTQYNADQIYDYQYNILWDYLKDKFPKTKVDSLDKTNPYHKKVWNL